MSLRVIMHQHPILTDEVSIKVCHIKVINKYWFSKFFKLKVSNFDFFTNSGNKYVTDFKITCRYPTLFLNIERVICGSVDSFTVGSRNVQDFICFLDPDVKNLFKFCFARFGIVCPDLIANLNIFNANSS